MGAKQQKLVPELRFPEFNGEWNILEFGQIYSFKTTNSYSRENLNYEKGSVYNIHYGDIHIRFQSSFNLDKELVPYVNEEIDISRISEESYVLEGDVIIADASEDYNDIGKAIEVISLNNQRVLAGLHTFLARKEKNEIQTGFATFLMKTWSFRLEVMRIAQGTKVLGLSNKRFAKIPITLPTLPEQRKIADFLSSVDERIQLLQQKKEKLQAYKKGVMQQLFPPVGGRSPSKDETNPRLRFKQDDGSNFPDWQQKKLGEVGNSISYGIGAAAKTFDGVNKYLRITDIDEYNNSFNPSPLTSPEGNIESKYIMKQGDIVFARTGASVGKTYLYNEKDGRLIYAGFLIKFNFSGESKFIFYSTLLYRYKKWVSIMSVRSGQPGLNAEEYKSYEVSLPTLPEQRKIADFLSAIDEQIEQVGHQIEKTQLFKKGLLQKMFV